MNLSFTDVRKVEQNGRTYRLQRAPILPSVNRIFWPAWNSLSDGEKKRYVIRKEPVEGSGFMWVIYRMMPEHNGKPLSFALSYYLRSTEKLLDYQPVVVQHLCDSILRNNAAIDGSDTGLGKTYTALAVCRELRLCPAILCKKAGIATWRRALEYFEMKPLFVTNWEQAKTGRFAYARRTVDEWSGRYEYEWTLPKNVLLIFDEAHKANHDDSQNSALYRAARGYTTLSLSASIADRLTRLRPLFHLLGLVDWESFPDWVQEYGSFLRPMHASGPVSDNESLAEVQDLALVNKLIYPKYGYRLSYTHPSVRSHFPDAAYLTEIVTLSEANRVRQNRLYVEMLRKVEEYRMKGKQADALVADLRYRQAAELLKADVLAELARDYMQEGHSVCIFVNFRETLAWLAKALRTRSLVFGGQERHLSREGVIDAFQRNESRIILCMAGAGGESISLHDVHGGHPRISLVCPTYDPLCLKQVLGRTRRAGAKSVPVIKLVYAAGTVEEKVADRVNMKLDNIAAINDGDLMEPDLFALGIRGEQRKGETDFPGCGGGHGSIS